ncbi:MAG: hypothetical protein QOH72_453 [Solirubrobacteraceae bacterium]|nr:hypothetical protein [Solirubrobacteraceae bacterium]
MSPARRPGQQHHEQRHLPHRDLARRLRRRAQPEPGRPDRRGRHAPAPVGVQDRQLAQPARRGRGRAQPGLDRRRGGRREGRRLHHGPQHVRPRPRRVGSGMARLVGRGPAVPHAGLRPDQPSARVARDGGRHDVPLRHGRDRVRPRAGARGGRRPRRLDRGWREHDPAVPRRRRARRALPPHRPGRPRRRRAAASERRRPDARAGQGRRLAGGHARQVPRRARGTTRYRRALTPATSPSRHSRARRPPARSTRLRAPPPSRSCTPRSGARSRSRSSAGTRATPRGGCRRSTGDRRR